MANLAALPNFAPLSERDLYIGAKLPETYQTLPNIPDGRLRVEHPDPVPPTKVEVVGPKLNIRSEIEGSPGDRALVFDPEDGGFGLVGVQQGETGESYIRENYSEWKKVTIPVSVREYTGLPSSPRQFFFFGNSKDRKIMCIHDFSVSLFENGEFTKIYPEALEDDRTLQTGLAYEFINVDSEGKKFNDTRFIVAGSDMLQGIITMTMSEAREIMKHNKLHPGSSRKYNWKRIEDLPNPNGSYIRGLTFDPVSQTIFYVGWRSADIPHWKSGIGINLIDAKTLRPIQNHPFSYKDYLGDIPGNSIKVFYHRGRQIVVAGTERSEFDDRTIEHTGLGVVKIWIDGVLLPEKKVNGRRIVEKTGGIDIITSGHGFEVIDIYGQKVLVASSFSKHLSAVAVDDLLDDRVESLNWVRITQNPEGSRSFGAVHIGKTKDQSGNPIIYSGRIVYGNSLYQPAAFIHFVK